ncbi:MAG TPA: DNA repair protein RecN [Steroidobacteraceae bacterium]|nr:DNA repair protein RecN [Steroidobacteraceae bacterium]
MLTHLQIRDFAIVDAVELEFDRGFTVLTGETGAGKSILVDALLLAVGGRADSGAVRHGAERSEVSATFALRGNTGAVAWLDEQSIGHDGECQLRRVVAADGRGRAYVNGQAVPVQSLRALGELLVDVHGQLEFQSLARRGYQREALDASGRLETETTAVREAHQAWHTLDQQRTSFEQRLRDREARLDLLRHYVAELAALDPKPGEGDALAEERKRIAGLGRLAEGTAQVESLLSGDDGGVVDALGRAHAQLRQLVALDAGLEPTVAQIEEASIASREALTSLRRYTDTLEADPARQEWLEARLAAMEAVARKHRIDVAALADLRDRLEAELAELDAGALTEAALQQQLAQAAERYLRAASRLSERRRAAAAALDAKVTASMQTLGMPGGVFKTRIEAQQPPVYSAHGNDEIEFLVSANPGQPERPLAKVASGGELSRISLALQVAAVDAAPLPCLVFDEVDAGVGGAVAEMVGRQLHALATRGQVLCVTHLPQVAAQSDRQLRVSKQVVGGATRTRIDALDATARVEEIARMLGGTKITERTLEHAREMLDSGRRAAPPASPNGTATKTERGVRAASGGSGSPRARSARAK